jgi:hypothetical protein
MLSRFIILFISMPSIFLSAQEQYNWKVTLNKKIVLQHAPSDDTSALVLRVKKEELNNNGVFKIDYIVKKGKDLEGNWFRTLALFEPGETSVYQKDSATQLYLYNKDILKLLWSRKKLTVYTWATPPDPAMAAVIRIRREKMFTIELED